MTFADWMRASVGEMEVTPCPIAFVNGKRVPLTWGRMVRLLNLLTKR